MALKRRSHDTEEYRNRLEKWWCNDTSDGISYDPLGQVCDRTPGVSIIGAADVAEAGHILARHQLIGLWGVPENCDEEQEESACELIVHRTRVHGPVAWQEGSAQDTHVLPLERQEEGD